MLPTLPAGFTDRAPRPVDDLAEVLDLMIAGDVAVYGAPDYTEDDLREDWRLMRPEQNARVVIDDAGAIVGYGFVKDRDSVKLFGDVVVQPSHFGRGIGTWLTRWVEQRTRERVGEAPDGTRVSLEFATRAGYEAAESILRSEAYECVRYMLRMTIDMEQPPPAPVLPGGTTLRTFARGEDERALWQTIEESFADHWGHVPRSFERWGQLVLENTNFRPQLTYLAVAPGGEIAGAAICHDFMDIGWVGTLGVRRPWRRTGVGLALLHQAFGDFYAAGRRRVSLGVDAQSLTGATRLYERAGMRPERRHVFYEKVLRDGIDLATRVLAD